MLEQHAIMATGTLLNLIRRRGAEPHTVFGTVTTWNSDEVQHAEDERVHAELASIGLAGPDGIHPDLLATVDTIAQPQREYYGWIVGGHEGQPLNYTLLAGIGPREAFVLARNTDTDTLMVATVHPNELLENFIAQIPQLPPARSHQVAAAKGDVLGRTEEPDGEFQIMHSSRSRPSGTERAATEVKRILHLPRMGGGQLYVAARNRAGVRSRAATPVVYIDTGEGRWLTEEIPGAGEAQFVCTPATPQLLAERISKQHTTLPG